MLLQIVTERNWNMKISAVKLKFAHTNDQYPFRRITTNLYTIYFIIHAGHPR